MRIPRMDETLESCDSPVKITVGGKDWYYQTFYEGGNVSAVRLYDGGGDFVKEFKSLDRMSTWMKRKEVRAKEKSAKLGEKISEKYDEEKAKGRKSIWISEEEKAETQAAFMKRFAELMADSDVHEFANKIGLSAGVVMNYISGHRFPTAHAVKRIANRCGVTTDWLLGRVD